MKLYWPQIVPALLIGCIVGGAVGARFERISIHRFWQKGPDAGRVLRKFSRELNLDDQQQSKVKAILDSQHDKVMALHQGTMAKFKQLRDEMRSDIGRILRPEQREKFDLMTARWDEKHGYLTGEAAQGPAPGPK